LTGGVKGVPELSAAVENHARRGADVIKFFATGGVVLGNDVNTETYSDAEMRAIVHRAHALGRKVAAHAHGTAGIKDAVLAGVDSIEHGSAISEEILNADQPYPRHWPHLWRNTSQGSRLRGGRT
jgi:imidazolonepropionase-like amidohydrolase